MLRRYETIFISSPELSDDEYKEKNLKIQELISSLKGEVFNVDEWGKKKLAYEIKKQIRGFYTLIDYGGTLEVVRELEKNLRLDDKVLKYLTVKTSDRVEMEAIKKEKPTEKEPPEQGAEKETPQEGEAIE